MASAPNTAGTMHYHFLLTLICRQQEGQYLLTKNIWLDDMKISDRTPTHPIIAESLPIDAQQIRIASEL
jgi:hypothetical protein